MVFDRGVRLKKGEVLEPSRTSIGRSDWTRNIRERTRTAASSTSSWTNSTVRYPTATGPGAPPPIPARSTTGDDPRRDEAVRSGDRRLSAALCRRRDSETPMASRGRVHGKGVTTGRGRMCTRLAARPRDAGVVPRQLRRASDDPLSECRQGKLRLWVSIHRLGSNLSRGATSCPKFRPRSGERQPAVRGSRTYPGIRVCPRWLASCRRVSREDRRSLGRSTTSPAGRISWSPSLVQDQLESALLCLDLACNAVFDGSLSRRCPACASEDTIPSACGSDRAEAFHSVAG